MLSIGGKSPFHIQSIIWIILEQHVIHMMGKANLQKVGEDEHWMWCGVKYAELI